MQLVVDRLVATAPDGSTLASVDVRASGTHRLGPLVVDLQLADDDGVPSITAWSVANSGDAAVAAWSVALVFDVRHRGALRMFRHGYQSWSDCDVAVLGVGRDQSTTNTTGIDLFNGVHHADQRPAPEGDLRSEWVTALADDDTSPGDGTGALVLGFDDGADHDGTFRLRQSDTGRLRRSDTGAELWVEAFLGGARLDPGIRRPLHPVGAWSGEPVESLLHRWATAVGHRRSARVSAPFQVGWCSWYHYFHGVTEAHLRANLASAADWPFDVFQLDDGYQSAIGDWLTTNAKFPTDVTGLASTIAATGATPGIWIAPFIVAPDSDVATAHPEWLARTRDDAGPLPGMVNPEWGGGMDGIMFTLDTTHPEVLDHLTDVGRQLRAAGYDYLKVDFTFAPSFDGHFVDPTRTPAQRVRAGYEAIRHGMGDDAFILGCGAPLANVVGLVDGMRIGPDVAPHWGPDPARALHPFPTTLPSTAYAFRNTVARAFLHRALWLNDPDCVMLRTTETAMAPAAVRTWAEAVGRSGGMVLVSDDLALLDDDARQLLDEVVATGRAADAEAIAGHPPTTTGLLDAAPPTSLRSAGQQLVVDLADGTSSLHPAD
jgi:alpha-galactosidase